MPSKDNQTMSSQAGGLVVTIEEIQEKLKQMRGQNRISSMSYYEALRDEGGESWDIALSEILGVEDTRVRIIRGWITKHIGIVIYNPGKEDQRIQIYWRP